MANISIKYDCRCLSLLRSVIIANFLNIEFPLTSLIVHSMSYSTDKSSRIVLGILLGASLVAQFKTPIQVESDLLAAARGLFKCEAGIACILGTGSNSCFYDGKIVVKNVRAGGYILGDEGSGAVLGKMFLSDVLKGLAPKDVMADFFEKFRISPNEVMESVYNRPFPNRFLSTISYFLADYTNDDYVFNLITSNLRNFFTRNVCQYDYKNYPIRFVGSLANSYATILREVAGEFGIELDVIEETPMNGLIEFHALNIEEP